MKNRLKHNLLGWLIYSALCYLVLIPTQMWVASISISILFGFIANMMNDIITRLREINGEEFPHIKD